MPHRVLQGLPVVCPFHHLYSWPEEKATGLVQEASRAREAGERGESFFPMWRVGHREMVSSPCLESLQPPWDKGLTPGLSLLWTHVDFEAS